MSLSAPRSHTFLDHLGPHVYDHLGVGSARAKRYESDRILRLTAARRIDLAREKLDDAIRRCREQETPRGIEALERTRDHLDRVAVRLRAAGWDADVVPHSWAFHPSETEVLYALDQSIYDQVNHLVDLFESRAVDHDFLAHVRDDLREIERTIDERAIAKQRIFQPASIDL